MLYNTYSLLQYGPANWKVAQWRPKQCTEPSGRALPRLFPRPITRDTSVHNVAGRFCAFADAAKPLPRRRAGVLADVIDKRSNGSKWEFTSTVRVVIISTVTEKS